jgi:hypothetical protein
MAFTWSRATCFRQFSWLRWRPPECCRYKLMTVCSHHPRSSARKSFQGGIRRPAQGILERGPIALCACHSSRQKAQGAFAGPQRGEEAQDRPRRQTLPCSCAEIRAENPELKLRPGKLAGLVRTRLTSKGVKAPDSRTIERAFKRPSVSKK